MPNKPRLSFSHITIEDDTFVLSDGVEMGIKLSLPAVPAERARPPLIFLHGSFHSAWCWAENFMPYFAQLGYPCVALSSRGTSETRVGKDDMAKVKINVLVDDVLQFLHYLQKRACKRDISEKYDDTMRLFFDYISENTPSTVEAPVLIAHSFGGITAMKLLERLPKDGAESPLLLSNIVLLCPVPPSGITKMSMRAVKRNPVKGFRIMRGLAMKKAVTDSKLCRLLFFDQDLSNEQLTRYKAHFQDDSKVTLDLHDLADKLPIFSTDSQGCSTNIDALQFQGLVLGGSKDYIVDSAAVKETAKFFHVEAKVVKGAPHDVMLAKCWREVAKEINLWINHNMWLLAQFNP